METSLNRVPGDPQEQEAIQVTDSTKNVLNAWTEVHGDTVVAAYIGGGVPERMPAIRACDTVDDAREWVETEAAELDSDVKWLGAAG